MLPWQYPCVLLAYANIPECVLVDLLGRSPTQHVSDLHATCIMLQFPAVDDLDTNQKKAVGGHGAQAHRHTE
jgi:hypothetical protein